MKLGFSLENSYRLPMAQILELLAKAGFSAVSPSWQRDGGLPDIVSLARGQNLILQSLHGPLRGMPAMWSKSPETAQPLLRDLLQSATDCAAAEIPLLVVHPWNGVDYTFRQEDICFDHFDTFIRHVEALGICVAFENLEGPEFLAALMERYRSSKSVGFCWDSGHELCYTPSRDMLTPYRDRLIMTHLNDNLGVTDPSGRLQGTDDLHLFPFDGKIHWDQTVKRLKKAKPQEILNFEFKIRPKGDRCILDLYSQLSPEVYFREAFEHACRAVEGYFSSET